MGRRWAGRLTRPVLSGGDLSPCSPKLGTGDTDGPRPPCLLSAALSRCATVPQPIEPLATPRLPFACLMALPCRLL